MINIREVTGYTFAYITQTEKNKLIRSYQNIQLGQQCRIWVK